MTQPRFANFWRWITLNQNAQPPDLDEIWRDVNRRLSELFGGKKGGATPAGGGNGGEGRAAGIGGGLLGISALLLWLGSGFFIVQEGHQAVVLQFGKFHATEEAGFHWRLPWPLQAHETVNAALLRAMDIGGNELIPATGLRESSMLTEDENIVDIHFAVQYRIKSVRDFLFNNRDAEMAVQQAAETAIREIAGRSKMDYVLYEGRSSVATELQEKIQAILDEYKTGIAISSVTMGNVQAPEQVKAAFDDAVNANQDKERLKNEGQAYANDIVPRAQGRAARLVEEAKGYSARVSAHAEGDTARFLSVYREYRQAPQVTRERMYLEAMQEIFSNVTKVLVDARQNSMLYLPLEQILKQNAAGGTAINPESAAASLSSNPPEAAAPSVPEPPLRARESLRERSRNDLR